MILGVGILCGSGGTKLILSKLPMDAADVLHLYNTLEKLGVEIWVDGGWGVDALLERQTRPHKDLDIVIQQKDVSKLRELLEARGYKEIKLEIARPHNFVLADDNSHEIDVHVIVLDEQGNGIYGPVENGEMYPADALAGRGMIAGQTVRCISAEWTIKFHSGYELKETDYRDVSALCEKFGIQLPAEYESFRPGGSDSQILEKSAQQIED
jgi:lincosamide nucleotidyltransferase A/C/D/E